MIELNFAFDFGKVNDHSFIDHYFLVFFECVVWAVEHGAVLASQICKFEAAGIDYEPGMLLTNGGLLDDDTSLSLGPTDNVDAVIEGHLLLQFWMGEHHKKARNVLGICHIKLNLIVK